MSGQSEHYDVIVVGAGYGGVTTAALCAKAGKRVLLLDKATQAGGKAQTIRKGGYAYEMWPVLSLPADGSKFHELVAELGLDPSTLLVPEGDRAIELKYLRSDGTWSSYIGPSKQAEDPLALDQLEKTFGVAPDDVEKMVAMVTQIFVMPDDEIDALDDTGTLPWMRSFGVPDPVIAYMSAMLNLVFVAPVDRVPASEGIRTMRQLFLGGGGRYHAGGYGRIAELCAEYVEAHGGTFLTKARVERILVEDGRAVGVATAGAEYRAPVVVSNAGIQPTVLKLLGGPGDVPETYAKEVEALEPGLGMVGVRYFLDARVLETGMIVAFSDRSWWDTERYEEVLQGDWPDVPLVFAAVTTEYDPSLAPEGHQIILLGFLGSADPKAEINDEAIARGEAAVAQMWPGIPEHIIRREVYTAASVSNLTRDAVVPGQGGECIGLSQVIGQCGRSKPDARTPLPGLFIVGTDAGGWGCGTHQAVESGMNVAEMVLAELGETATA